MVGMRAGQWGLWDYALRPFAALAAAPRGLFPFVPVLIGTGVGLWFQLPIEPTLPFYALIGLVTMALLAIALRAEDRLRILCLGLACVLIGPLAGGLRVHLIAAPMLDFRYYGPVQGRVVEIDRSQSDALRLTLDQVVLEDMAPARTPLRVRLSLHGDDPGAFLPGQVVIATGHLSAPQGPAEPGTFDFRRMAFFDQLGAVGYTASTVLLWEQPKGRTQGINRLRSYLSNAMMAAMPGDAGAFASGVMTGDRSGLSLQAVQDLRDSSLAHLLAISGMNMAFISAFVFALIRYGIALVPPLALRVSAKKVAAVLAFGVALFYLLLSGANVATERAFIMVSVMLGAVLLDRRALTLRSVAISAVILLLWQPESLLEPGFQMSYAATVALIVGFGAMDRQAMRGRLPWWGMPFYTLVLSSVLGGFATAPYAAAHFNRFTDYGLLANLLTVPVMGAVVMPAGAIAALLAPFGLAGPALWVMEQGSRWILFIAHWVAGWEGAVTGLPTPSPLAVPLITLGGLWLIVWQGRARHMGWLPVALALVLWGQHERPLALIDAEGGIVGIMTPQGRAISAPKGAGFTVKSWLENDGDLAGQEAAAERAGFWGEKNGRSFVLGDWRGVILKGKGAEKLLVQACAVADLVVLSGETDAPPDGCHVIDRLLLRQTGPLALSLQGDGALRVEPTNLARRLWSVPEPAEGVIVWRKD
jgi:competence protein ComEC